MSAASSHLFAPALWLLSSATTVAAQDRAPQPDMPVDAATRNTVIEGVLERLTGSYVFPARAVEMAAAVRGRMARHEYDRIGSSAALADSLTAHLQAVSHDKHLRVLYRFAPLPNERPDEAPTAQQQEQRLAYGRQVNFGIGRAERLAGNVGYLEVRSFGFPAEMVEDAVAAAMDSLAGVDALIVDVRRNGGGEPGTVALVSSYLFDRDTVHLNSLFWRPTGQTEQYWTRPEVRGARLGSRKPVYVLTSGRTFSAAEEFTYNLQSRKRATIVGETTGGGAHPGGVERVTPHFAVRIPSGRAINPVTGTNWEGTGVRPELAVPAADALAAAHRAALERLLKDTSDPARRLALQQALRGGPIGLRPMP
jgi:retinol-binding protein 3